MIRSVVIATFLLAVVMLGMAGADAQAPSAAASPAVPQLPDMPEASLFLKESEVRAIEAALNGNFMPPELETQPEPVATTDAGAVEDTGEPKPYVPRRIRFSGMLYTSSESWIVWLNGKRLTPGRLLPEIVDIKVDRKEIHLKWSDHVLKKIISISLKPHQVYDIDTGILLPE